ncbi:MAG: YdcF family protein [Muribaculaceae bacterium]|nr:YdcF family protein [Muribaculaceae bacterium]
MTVTIVAVISCYAIVSANAKGKTYNEVKGIPSNLMGLLLGTSPFTSQGGHNYYFDNRIKAAAELYHNRKIGKIIASGGDYSNRKNGYDELSAMRDSLVAHGVPDSIIILDYQGTRTINSIVNARYVDSITVISQKYHNERAIWLAEHYGLHAIAYNATTPDIMDKKIKNISREFLARVKMFLDLATDK